MECVHIQITRFVMEHQPNIVECRLIEASGRKRLFIDKTAYFTADYLDAKSVCPHPGVIACEIISTHKEQDGRIVVTMDTWKIWNIEDTNEETRFVVLADQLTDC